MYQHQLQEQPVESLPTRRQETTAFGSRLSDTQIRRRVGEFSWNLLSKFGLLEVFRSLATREEPGLQTAYALEELSLPILGKLLQLRFDSEPAPLAVIRPILFLPLAEWLETEGESGALSKARRTLEEQGGQHEEKEARFKIALDRWHGNFSSKALETFIREFLETAPSGSSLLGPSAKDIKDALLAARHNPNEDAAVRGYLQEQLLPVLRAANITSIYGGTSLRTHRFANELGLSSFVAHDMNTFRLGGASSSAPRFSDQLLAVRREILAKRGACKGWMPLFRVVLDRTSNAAQNPLGLEALKAVALAALLLPEVEYIQAPVALYGHKAADLALRFGANDLGVLALNDETAMQLQIPKLTEIQEIFSSSPVKLQFAEDV